MKNQVWTEFTDGIDKPKYYMHKIIATKGKYYWEQQRKNKTIIKYQVDTTNQGHIKRSREYYDLVCCKRRRRQTQIERHVYEKVYLDRKKVKEELYNKYFVLKEK